MRCSHPAALLALPAACLYSFVTAVPSPAAHVSSQPHHQQQQQQPLSPAWLPHRSQSQWRRLSDRVIGSLWPLPKSQSGRESSSSSSSRGGHWTSSDRHAPPHTIARYSGDVVLRFNLSTPEETKSLAEAADTLLLDVWDFCHHWVDIRLSKDIVGPLLGLLPTSLHTSHFPLLGERELAQAIYNTYPLPKGQASSPPDASHSPHDISPLHHDRPFSPSLHRAAPNGPETNVFFADYQPLSVIDPWLHLLASLFTTHVRKVDVGLSAQGRSISGLRVGVHPTNNADPDRSPRKTVLVVGGLHAREWISTSTVNYLAYNLVTGYGKTPAITHLLEAFDFVFIPTVNPDGYAYTWDTDRLWRKNRQQTHTRFCPGIDIDRAFGFQWDGAATTAGNPCSESFAGEEPFEAVEAQRLATWARNETEKNNVEFVGFLDLHSYSQQILYPYSYSCDDTPPGLENLEELAMGLGKAIRVAHGHSYEVMPACEGNGAAVSEDHVQGASSGKAKGKGKGLGDGPAYPRMEAAGGSALDYFYHELRVRYSYQLKLRDRGMYGFLLPKEEIVPTGREILDAMLYFGRFLENIYSEEQGRGGAAFTEEEAAEREVIDRKHDEDSKQAAGSGDREEGVVVGHDGDDDEWVWVDGNMDSGDDWRRRRR